jgi:lantibiotic modifying enzyme
MGTLWRPVLEGDLAERAWEAVRAIAGALEAAPTSTDGWRAERGASLAGGKAGLALFHGYLSLADDSGAEAQAALSEERLGEAIEELAATPMSAGLYAGFTGIAWATEHLGRLLAAGEPEDPEGQEDVNEEIDGALLSVLVQSPWRDQYDLISGLVGFGVYALERFPRPSAVRCLEAVVDRLDETAERQEGGITWFTPPEWLPPSTRGSTPLGYYNLGLAHGVPGIIALLAEACRLHVHEDRARPLLEETMRWFLAQSRPGERGPSCYATFVGQGFEPRPSRLAWCYGDPGIAAALLLAARATGRKDWEEEALALAARAAQSPPEVAGVRDAGLCHGAFGLAHLYNRIHQAGGGELFAESARQWYRLGLDMRRPDQGVAGFPAWLPGDDGQLQWVDDRGFLTGAAGVGLSLLAGVSAVEPDWDRVLLVAVPPRSRGSALGELDPPAVDDRADLQAPAERFLAGLS